MATRLSADALGRRAAGRSARSVIRPSPRPTTERRTMDRCVVCRDSGWLLGRGSNRRIVGQSAAQRVLPRAGGAADDRCRGESLLPSMERQTLIVLRNLEPIPEWTLNRFPTNGWCRG